MNRETWLNALAEKMAPRFEELGKPIPRFRVAVGWTSAGKVSHVGGECWHSFHSADGVFEVLIAPILDENIKVAAVLCHELCHAAAGFKCGHKGEFATLMAAMGMVRPFTDSIPGPKFQEWVAPFLEEFGHIPHARIILHPDRAPAPEGQDADEEEEGGSSNQRKKQGTRMLKACCEECGYTVRLSKKWAKDLGAVCPQHGSMEVEGLEEEED